MAKVVAPIVARIETIGRLKESAYQPGTHYRSVLFIDQSKPPDSEESKIWKSLSEAECAGLTKGAIVQLVPAGKTAKGENRHNIIVMDGSPSPAVPVCQPAPQVVGWSVDEKRALAAKVNQHADLLKFCLQIAKQKFGELMQTEESIRALGVTLYINALKENR